MLFFLGLLVGTTFITANIFLNDIQNVLVIGKWVEWDGNETMSIRVGWLSNRMEKNYVYWIIDQYSHERGVDICGKRN